MKKTYAKLKTITLTIKDVDEEAEAAINKMWRGEMWISFIEGKLHAKFVTDTDKPTD